MSSIEIVHPVPVDEASAWAAAMAMTFLEDPSPDAHPASDEARRRDWSADRRWGARSAGRWVGTLAALDRSVTVPGGELAVDALSMVTVAATHRRRGVLRSMLTDSLHAARDRGDAASVLIAAEWPIYGRFGYSPAETTAWYALNPRLPGASVAPADADAVRQADVVEVAGLAPAVFARARQLRAGNIDRPSSWWDRVLGMNGLAAEKVQGRVPTYVVHDGADDVDGYLAWVGTRPFDIDGSAGAIEVVDLCAASDQAYRGLWVYLTGMDLIGAIVIKRRPIDEPLRWLLRDGRSLRQTNAADGVWLRLLDVARALSARRYGVADQLVIEVLDDAPGGYAAGRYLLEGGPDGASCVPTSTLGGDLALDQRVLASSYFGGFSLAQQAHRNLVDEHTPGATARFDALFATRLAPWCATNF